MKNSAKNGVELHPIIDNALLLVEMHEHSVGIYEDIIEWDKEGRAKIEFFEDETEFNQNFLGSREGFGEEFVNNAHKELRYHKEKLENQRILVRIYMEAFNGGWIF